ncbi:hypothetical protein Q7C18_02885 [Nesterenkonia sp. CL21]|uniref:hypothetical protein n=1 Tax=Nesterenkonia sp. CL21 TaxID=3064894 RepID=UPI0028782F9C|nr:hypothetical protein [Nesterenkonia sp. CL21]MDS2171633.1 hypothetical protein [Nesterenkonia sp. CL21]
MSDAIITVEEYAGTEETGVDYGRLKTFTTANHMRRKGSYAPMPKAWLTEVEEVLDRGAAQVSRIEVA